MIGKKIDRLDTNPNFGGGSSAQFLHIASGGGLDTHRRRASGVAR